MNWKSTWILLGLCVVLALVVLFDRRTPDANRPPPRLFTFRVNAVTNIQLRLTNQLLLRVERARADAPWNMTVPLSYPAQPFKIEWLLQALEQTVPQTEISPEELKAGKRTVAEFGLDIPHATLTLLHDGQRTEVMFGARTPVGDGVYAQVLNLPDIYVLNSELASRLPKTHHDWRANSLFLTASSYSFNGVEVRAGGRGFALVADTANNRYLLTRPTLARADPAKVVPLLRKILDTQVQQFISDSPRVDLEQYGLQSPEVELALMNNTNEVFVVQFGRSPNNDPTAVYARRLAHTNIVLVPRDTLTALQISHADLRDLHLITWPTNSLSAIEVVGQENFTLRRGTNGMWLVGDNPVLVADTNAVREFLDVLSRLEGTVEKDVVTDFATYNLNPPARQYLLTTAVTNSSGLVSNRVVAELQLGGRHEEKVFARRPDEATVYGVPAREAVKLPRQAWQLQDRSVWTFSSNQVYRVAVRHGGRSVTLQRKPDNTWSIAEGSSGVVGNYQALDHTMERLGELRANVWLARGEEARADFGFDEQADRIALDLKIGDRSVTRILEFAGRSPNSLPYALAVVDGQTWVFEFPADLHFEVISQLFSRLFR